MNFAATINGYEYLAETRPEDVRPGAWLRSRMAEGWEEYDTTTGNLAASDAGLALIKQVHNSGIGVSSWFWWRRKSA